jgi:hypothetical protein
MNLMSNGEIDFLIVSLQTKSIIQIEAKKGNSQKNIKAAAIQLEKGFEFFNENFPFPSSENWSYIKVGVVDKLKIIVTFPTLPKLTKPYLNSRVHSYKCVF